LCSSTGEYVLDTYNGPGVPRNIYVRATGGAYNDEILKAENTLAGYERPEIRDVSITAADGITPLYGKLILPVNFDKNKKYPVIVYLYNGPNVQLVHNSFPESGNLWYEYMAQHGYIVFTMDGRGSWNRGLDFEQATFRRLGDTEMADQLKGVDYLKSLPYVDTARMGVHGWSFGGFMTTSLMLKHPGVFKCAVAGGPVMDWKMYEVMYTERYMDRPQDNPEGYENANLLDHVKNLKGKLLLIHGTNDNTVVWQHSINFLKKSVDEGIQVDYFVYPGYEHNVRGKDRVHLMQKITDYFDLYLKPGE
jgi:dipeptidyl-peptidase-4